jgi:uncharacterized protein
MPKIVLDCNCLIQIIPKKSKYRIIWDKLLNCEIGLCVTTDILNEYCEVLTHFYSPVLSENVVNAILNFKKTEKVEVYFNWNLISSDQDDNKYVDCAIACNAKYLVTEDEHFKVLKSLEFPRVNIIKLDAYYRKIK